MRIYFARTLDPRRLPTHLEGAKIIALGDLHGSYHKLAETLIAAGLVSMPSQSAARFRVLSEAFRGEIASEKHYPPSRNVYQCYVTSRLNGKSPEKALKMLLQNGFTGVEVEDVSRRRETYRDYYNQLRPLIREMEWIGKPGQQFVLIGDALSDRGPLDHLTLDIVEHLNPENANRIIWLASNHDHAGMQSFIHKRLVLGWQTAGSLGRSLLISRKPDQVQVRFTPDGEKIKVQIEPVLQEESGRHFADRYKRYLQDSRLMHYKADSKTLFTHAPIVDDNLDALNTVLWLYYPDCIQPAETNPDNISSADVQKPLGIDWANRFWKTYVEKVFCKKALEGPVETLLMGERAYNGFLWRRESLNDERVLPFYGGGVNALVHGHDQQSLNSRFATQKQAEHADLIPEYTVVNLDQQTRKGIHNNSAEEDDSTLYVEF